MATSVGGRCQPVEATWSWSRYRNASPWGAVASDGSGSFVEFVGDGGEVGLVVGDHRAFGQVLADQAVGVFVRGSLPRGVGVGEVDRHADRGS